MHARRDLVLGWLRKADSDLAALDSALATGVALDAVCFHAQQAAERLLKAYLISRDVNFPLTHNLSRLILLCQPHDPPFASLIPLAEGLTPYAVRLRYDTEFWPSIDEAQAARNAVLAIKSFVLERLPSDVRGGETP